MTYDIIQIKDSKWKLTKKNNLKKEKEKKKEKKEEKKSHNYKKN